MRHPISPAEQARLTRIFGGQAAQPRVPLEPDPLDDQFAQLWAMTPAERVAAMRRGELTHPQLCKWAARYPEEVPLLDGEFCFIRMLEPEYADADVAAVARRR